LALILPYQLAGKAIGLSGSGRAEIMAPDAEALIGQFRAALSAASGDVRQAVRRELLELFHAGAVTYSTRQLAIFDRLMGHLADRADRAGLVEMADALAAVDNAPSEVLGRLSSDNDIAVAAPILTKSQALTDAQLVAVARTKSQDHPSAIAARARINEPVVDALMERGTREVMRKVAVNLGARLSEMAFVKIITDARTDKALAAALARRKDVPPELQPFLRVACA
jgi:uncharacterized protein (DUF2336 family)